MLNKKFNYCTIEIKIFKINMFFFFFADLEIGFENMVLVIRQENSVVNLWQAGNDNLMSQSSQA